MADEIIKALGLEPHPEGGYFKETFRDPTKLDSGRSSSTMIYYLLKEDQCSLLHRLDASEGWHFYAGNTLQVIELDQAGPIITKLGTDIAGGETPQHIVRPGRWFGAKPAEGTEWVLAGCTVAPAFEIEKFEFGVREKLLEEFPKCKEWIEKLTSET